MDSNLPQTTIAKTDNVKNTGFLNAKKIFLIAGVIILLIAVIWVTYSFLITRPKPVEEAEKPPPPKQGAIFDLSATPQEASLGGQIKVSVLVKSDLDAANLFVAKLKFPNDLLKAKSIDLRSESSASGFIKDWFISNWVENTVDNNTGSVSLVGGVPNPGFQTSPESSNSAMADIIFEPIASGEAKITFDDTSAIYRNSDNINILVGKKDITVKILGEEPTASPSAKLEISLTPSPTNTPKPSPVGSLEGDINKDSRVDLVDLSYFLSIWGKSGFEVPEADLNKDQNINVFDYSKLVNVLKNLKVIQ